MKNYIIFSIRIIVIFGGFGRNERVKKVLEAQCYYKYLFNQCKSPMLPLFETNFKLTIFSLSLLIFIINVLLFV